MARLKHRPIPNLSSADLHRFWSKIERKSPDECWPWKAHRSKTKNGEYGLFDVADESFNSHRIAYFIATGIDPGDLLVCHSCDNPPCCNPSHLFAGTCADNSADMASKGRSLRGRLHAHPENMARGERHHNSKLTSDEVLRIRSMAADGIPKRAIARQFHVSQPLVQMIVARKWWRHI